MGADKIATVPIHVLYGLGGQNGGFGSWRQYSSLKGENSSRSVMVVGCDIRRDRGHEILMKQRRDLSRQSVG
jgi:hypothetical protein